ncbi:MAG: S41 family peptidase [Candidatus Microgenomates bacterium]|jgi:carboxyl-terminal processing protease
MPFRKVRKVVVLVFSFCLIFSLGYFSGYKGYRLDYKNFPKVIINRNVPIDKSTVDFSLFWRVWDNLEKNYYDKSKLVPVNMVYGAIEGMVSSLGDPYTSFLPPQENKVVEEDLGGSFDGVGIQIGYKGTQLAVISALPGTPAEKAGIKPGDLIVGIKDASKNIDQGTVGISLPDAVEIIRGPAGSKITLMILRDGSTNPITFNLTRATVNVPSVILTFPETNKDVAVLKLLKFGGDTDTEWQNAVTEILKNNQIDRVVLDLRDNPGGYLEEAVSIASDFLKTGSVVAIQETGDGTRTDYRTQKLGLLTNMKVVVLVNGGSASAAEILAGALRDDLKVQLVGDKTFGKGTIQEPETLDNGAGLHVTIAKWLTPNGTWVHGSGLEPDVKISMDENSTVDVQLNKALSIISAN